MWQEIQGLWRFSGRANRKRYWLTTLGSGLVFFGAILIFGMGSALTGLGVDAEGLSTSSVRTTINVAIFLVLFATWAWVQVALTVRRLHDRNRAGWWVIGVLLAYVGPDIAEAQGEEEVAGIVIALLSAVVSIWALVELGFLRGTDGANRFGPDPLGAGEDVAEVFG